MQRCLLVNEPADLTARPAHAHGREGEEGAWLYGLRVDDLLASAQSICNQSATARLYGLRVDDLLASAQSISNQSTTAWR